MESKNTNEAAAPYTMWAVVTLESETVTESVRRALLKKMGKHILEFTPVADKVYNGNPGEGLKLLFDATDSGEWLRQENVLRAYVLGFINGHNMAEFGDIEAVRPSFAYFPEFPKDR